MSAPRERWACVEAGCHDYTDPVVVRQGWHLLHASAEVAISFCRRCGATLVCGWSNEVPPAPSSLTEREEKQ